MDTDHCCKQLTSVYQVFEQLLLESETNARHGLVSSDGESDVSLDLADCALAPAMFFAQALPQLYGHKSTLPDYPKVNRWWERVQAQPAIERVNYELQRGFHTYLST